MSYSAPRRLKHVSRHPVPTYSIGMFIAATIVSGFALGTGFGLANKMIDHLNKGEKRERRNLSPREIEDRQAAYAKIRPYPYAFSTRTVNPPGTKYRSHWNY